LLPKITLVSAGAYEGAGLRIDDFVLFGLLGVVIFSAFSMKSFKVTAFETCFFLLIFWFFVAFTLNIPQGRGSILYVLRLIEYFALFYIGAMAPNPRALLRVLVVWSVLNAVLSVLQYLGIVGGMMNGVYVPTLERATGLTNNATETSMVALLIFAFYTALNRTSEDFWRLCIMFSITAIAIGVSGSRMPIALLLLVFAWHMWSLRGVYRITIVAGFVGIVLFAMTSFSVQQINPSDDAESQQSLQTRVFGLFKEGGTAAVVTLFDRVQFEQAGFTNADVVVARESNKKILGDDADLSLLVRFSKWAYAVKTWANQGVFYQIFGVGPGVWYNALDGGLLRILTESGFFALITFLALYFVRPKYGDFDPTKVMILIFFAGNLVVDHYFFYKVMACFLMIVGACSAHIGRQRQQERQMQTGCK